METLRKDMDEPDAVSMLVVGTESGHVIILEPSGTQELAKVQLPSAPVFMAVTGLHSVESRIVCACRDGHVYTIKNGALSGVPIELESLPSGLARIDKNIVVACMSASIHTFHIKGKRVHSIYLPAPATSLEVLELTHARSVKALLAGLANGEVRLYNDKLLIASLQINEPLSALRFGCYGREESALVAVTTTGSLVIKMLQRQADLDGAGGGAAGPPPEQDVPLSIPKKTKLYVEQTQRERDQATEMHRIFQRDLCKLRLSTARAYVKIITDGQGSISYSAGSSLRLTAQVQGLGPRFKLKLQVQNTGRKSVEDLVCILNYNAMLYKLARPVIKIPILVPRVQYKIDAEVTPPDRRLMAI